MAGEETSGGASGNSPNTGQTPGGEPAAPPQGYAGYAGGYPPNPPYPSNPTGMTPGAPGTPGAAQGQPFANPPYGYPPYPYPPAQYAYPYPYAVPQPPRESNRALWITLSIVGGVLLVVCVSCSVLFAISIGRAANNVNQFLGPTIAADTFCMDMQEQQYAVAYGQLSRTLQSQMTQSQFVSAANARDQASGPVTGCTPDTSSPRGGANGAPALVHVTVTRGSGSGADFTSSGDLTLVQEDGTWKVDAIDSSLGLI
jgi:hypothetical protein